MAKNIYILPMHENNHLNFSHQPPFQPQQAAVSSKKDSKGQE